MRSRRRFDDTVRAAGLSGAGVEAYIRLLVTRGIGELSYDPAACATPSVIVIAKPHVELPDSAYEQGVTVALVSVVRNHPDSVSPRVKSNNLLNNSLAMQEAIRRGGFEGIMRNYRGELAECTTSNLFHRQGRRGPHAADRRRPAGRNHARVSVRDRRRDRRAGA